MLVLVDCVLSFNPYLALDAQLAEKLRDAADRPEESARQLPPIKQNPPSKDRSPARDHRSHIDDVDDMSHKFDVLLRHMSQIDTKIKRLEAEQESNQVTKYMPLILLQ